MKELKILLVDDHRMLRDMWAFILDKEDWFRVVGSTGGNEDVARLSRKLCPDIILMDIAMTPVDGFELTQRISAFDHAPKIIGVSMYNFPSYAKKMLQSGAKGYLTKNCSKEELISAIREVSEGNRYIGEEIRDVISGEQLIPSISKSAVVNLTNREREVLALVKEGHSSKEISLRLDVGQKTIDVHRYNILKKLKLRNTAALVNYANLNGL